MANKGGAGSRARNKIRRKMERKRKASERKLLYKHYADIGRQKGSRRAKSKKQVLVKNFKHQVGFCGNPGCRRCFPDLNPAPRLSPLPKAA